MPKNTTRQSLRLIRAVYDTPQQADIPSSVDISVLRISALTGERFTNTRTKMLTAITCLRSIGGWDKDNGNSCQSSLILNLCPQVGEVPASYMRAEDFPLIVCRLADALQVLKSNSFVLFLRHLHDAFCNRVVYNMRRSPFSARETFQNSLRVLCSFALKLRTHTLAFDTILFKLFPRQPFARREGYDVFQTKIHSNKVLNISDLFFGYFNRLKQIPLTFLRHEIGFALDIRQKFLVVANKRQALDTSIDSPDAHCSRLDIVRQDAGIVGNRTQWLKPSECFVVEFVRIRDFCKRTHNRLSRQQCRMLYWVVNKMVESDMIEGFLFPRRLRNLIANTINLSKRGLKNLCLKLVGQKFYLKCQFHSFNITHLFENVKQNLKKGVGQFLCQMNQAVSLPDIL